MLTEPPEYARELEVALRAVTQASRVCQSVQSSITPDVLEKKDRSPVTIADFASQAVVCRTLGQEFPDDPVIGEEDSAALKQPENAGFLDRIRNELAQVEITASSDDICRWIDRGGASEYSDRFWTLDPIDGTKGFLRGEQYAVSLALIVGGEIQVAVLGCPNLSVQPNTETNGGSLFFAVRGHGSAVIPFDKPGERLAVRVSATPETSQARFCESVESGHSAHDKSSAVAELLDITNPPVRLDSQAKYAVVARGEADIYLRLPTRADYRECIWDHAGGVLIVQEAGGQVTDVTGKPLEFTHGRKLEANQGVIVTNGVLHDPVVAAVRQVLEV